RMSRPGCGRYVLRRAREALAGQQGEAGSLLGLLGKAQRREQSDRDRRQAPPQRPHQLWIPAPSSGDVDCLELHAGQNPALRCASRRLDGEGQGGRDQVERPPLVAGPQRGGEVLAKVLPPGGARRVNAEEGVLQEPGEKGTDGNAAAGQLAVEIAAQPAAG